jgi:hypothetical protein
MKYLKSILILSNLFLLSSSAQAIDYKNYNGSSCKSILSLQAERLQHGYDGTYNNSNIDTYINCPIIVDQSIFTGGTSISYIYYKGNSNNGQFKCFLKSKDLKGLTIQVKKASRSGTGWLKIPKLTTESANGSLALYCLLPKKGLISTIRIGEERKSNFSIIDFIQDWR